MMRATRRGGLRDGRARRRLVPARRRGAVLVLTAVLLTVVLLGAAFAVDYSRFLAARNAVQGAADAGAMAAALQLTRSSPGSYAAWGKEYAARNPVFGASKVVVDSVLPGVWSPSDNAFVPKGSVDGSDAAAVYVRYVAPTSFAKLLGPESVEMRARAIAWGLASVANTPCAKPWSITYEDLLKAVGKSTTDSLTAADVRTLGDTVAKKHYFSLRLGSGDSTVAPGNYYAIHFPAAADSAGVNESSGTGAYEADIAGCNPLAVGNWVKTRTGSQGDPTLKGLRKLCMPLDETVKPHICYRETKGGAIGVPVVVPVWRASNVGGGKNIVRVESLASFLLTHVNAEYELVKSGKETKLKATKVDVQGFFVAMQMPGMISGTRTTLYRPILVY